MRTGYEISAPQMTLEEAKLEFETLSIGEQDRARNDVYGRDVNDTVEQETAEYCQMALERMETFLNEIPVEDKIQYNRALTENSSFVQDPSRRLQFLRCDRFDAKKAARRYVNYWNEKVKLWGNDCLVRTIRISDFSEEDQVALRQGGIQYVFNSLDKFHRGIMLFDPSRFDQRIGSWKSNVRLFWYMQEAVLEDIAVQRNGLVYIHGLGPQSTIAGRDRRFDVLAIRLGQTALPTRVVAVHHILSDNLIPFVVPFVLYLIGPEMRARYKLYNYSKNVINDKLAEFGISKSMIPTDFCGEANPMYNEWLESRKANNK